MPENTKVHAPYNFVPFSNEHIERYACAEDLPRHDLIDPDLKSGEIHVTLRSETPVLVSDGQKKDEHFFRNAAGKIVIPGSTVRGMTRANMQILGLGWMRPQENEDMDDYQIFFREMASARQSVGGDLKEYYQTALDVQNKKTPSGKPFSVPCKVQAGYLCRDRSGYYIQPVRGDVLRVPRTHPDAAQFHFFAPNQCPDDVPGRVNYARAVPVSYLAEGKNVKCIAPEGRAGMKQGFLLATGRPIGKQGNCLYLFPQEDRSVKPVPVSEEDVLSYQVDLEARKNSLKAYYDIKFWALPKGNERKPVFFVRHDCHTYFGCSRFLRIGYKHKLSGGLPPYCQKTDSKAIDYPSAILGFARGQNAYRSRVSFEDFSLTGQQRELPAVCAVSGAPKPSYYPGYVTDGKHYNMDKKDGKDGFRLRGYKQYWLKDVQPLQPGKEKVTSKWHPLAAGSEFRGVIRYRNLTEDELGLLLWSLRLDENCFQTIGKGKPYGYGRMKVSIDALREFDFNALYTPGGLIGGAIRADDAAVERYIRAYDTCAAQVLGKNGRAVRSLRELDEIQDFFFLKRTVRDPKEVRYMQLDEYRNVRDPLETVQDVREEFARREKEKPKTWEEALDGLLKVRGAKSNKKPEK